MQKVSTEQEDKIDFATRKRLRAEKLKLERMAKQFERGLAIVQDFLRELKANGSSRK